MEISNCLDNSRISGNIAILLVGLPGKLLGIEAMHYVPRLNESWLFDSLESIFNTKQLETKTCFLN